MIPETRFVGFKLRVRVRIWQQRKQEACAAFHTSCGFITCEQRGSVSKFMCGVRSLTRAGPWQACGHGCDGGRRRCAGGRTMR